MSAERDDAVTEVQLRERIYRRLLALGDASAVLAAVLLAASFSHVHVTWFVLAVPLFAVAVDKVQGVYDRDDMVIHKSTIGEWRTVLQAAAITTIGIYLAWPALTKTDHALGIWLFFFVDLTMLAIGVPTRTIARRFARRLAPEQRWLIIGDPRTSAAWPSASSRCPACSASARFAADVSGLRSPTFSGLLPNSGYTDS